MDDTLVGLPIVEDLSDIDNPVLQRAVERVLKSLDDPDGIISAFQSFASAE